MFFLIKKHRQNQRRGKAQIKSQHMRIRKQANGAHQGLPANFNQPAGVLNNRLPERLAIKKGSDALAPKIKNSFITEDKLSQKLTKSYQAGH